MYKYFSLAVLLLLSVSDASCMVDGVRYNDTLSVRSGPGVYNSKVGSLSPNAKGVHIIKCIKKRNSSPWCKISYSSYSSKITGWVNSRYLYCPRPKPYYNKFCVDRVSYDDTLNVHYKPFSYSKNVGELAPYARNIHVNKCIMHNNGSIWCKINHYSKGVSLKGWVNAKYIVPCGN